VTRPYWWHGYPWLLCNLWACLIILFVIHDFHQHRWGWVALGVLAVIGAQSYADSHRKKYDRLNSKSPTS
jgi:hypothetical protein